MIRKYSKYQIATAIAILFHLIGIVGILFSGGQFFINATPINLLLSFVLLVWTQSGKNIFFWIFLVTTIVIGFTVEVIGVNTNYLFGNYTYGNVLGAGAFNVPFIIGINWFITIYCCGICMYTFLQKMISKLPADANRSPNRLRFISVIVDGATLALLFDILLEPVAIKLGLWKWAEDGTVPFFNYLCWFIISCVLLAIFQFCNFNKQNKFAINLLLIQAMFFLLLRTFMK
jgi:putative membrane protein